MKMLRLIDHNIDKEDDIRTFQVSKATAEVFEGWAGFSYRTGENTIQVAVGGTECESPSIWWHVLNDEMIALGLNPEEYGL